MYSVSAAFLTKMNDPQRVEHVRGTVDGISFTDRNIIALSGSSRCSDTKDITFGSAYIGQIDISFVNLNIIRGTWRGLLIDLEYGLETDDNHTTEWIPVGVYKIASAEWTDTGIHCTASDCLANLDQPFIATTTSGTIFDMLSLVNVYTGVEIGLTEAECNSLPNGVESLTLYQDNDITTFRDFVSWLACTVGGFATADREGRLILKSFRDGTVVKTLTPDERLIGSVFSDFATNYNGVVVVHMDSGVPMYYDGALQDGTYINIGSNPFIQYGVEETYTRQRNAIAGVASGLHFTPYQITLLNCPVFDLGDLIKCTGGIAGSDDLTCCVMSVEWNFKHAIDLQGYGADPSLTAGKSATQKALNGLKSKTSENEVVTHTFVNSRAFTLGEDAQVKILDIDFSVIKPKTIVLHHEIDLDTTATSEDGIITCQAFYYLNDELISYSPVTTWNNDGKHLLPLMYFLEELTGGESYDWEVRLMVSGGTATIARGDVHAYLQGQGLVAVEAWDGNIVVAEQFTAFTIGGVFASMFDTEPSLVQQVPTAITAIEDTFEAFTIGVSMSNMTDMASVVPWIESANRITENGDSRITEDSDSRVTE